MRLFITCVRGRFVTARVLLAVVVPATATTTAALARFVVVPVMVLVLA